MAVNGMHIGTMGKQQLCDFDFGRIYCAHERRGAVLAFYVGATIYQCSHQAYMSFPGCGFKRLADRLRARLPAQQEVDHIRLALPRRNEQRWVHVSARLDQSFRKREMSFGGHPHESAVTVSIF